METSFQSYLGKDDGIIRLVLEQYTSHKLGLKPKRAVPKVDSPVFYFNSYVSKSHLNLRYSEIFLPCELLGSKE